MARVRYLLLTMLLWAFILAWWAGLVLWVVATGAWPMGSEPPIVWPLWIPILSMPAIMAYLSWEYLWDQEKSRHQNPQIRCEKLQAKQKLLGPPSSVERATGEIWVKNKMSSALAGRDIWNPVQPRLNGGVVQRPQALAYDPTPAAPAIPTQSPCAAPRTVSAILRCSRSIRSPSIEGEGVFQHRFEEAVRQLMDLDQRR
jgi:hypothetical protein